MVTANVQVMFWIARPEPELRWRERQFLLNEIPIEPHHLAVFIDVGTRNRELLATARLEKTHALCFENSQCAIDDALQLPIIQNRCRPVRIYNITPR
jgi:hypothetical protein